MVEERLRLGWKTGTMGCLLPFFVLGAAMFGLAALSADYAAELAQGDRRGALIRMSAALSASGVNLPLAALALYFAFETFRFAWRWADEDALWADSAGLHFHGSLFRRSLGWDDLRRVEQRLRWRGRSQVAVLALETAAGRTIEIGGVDEVEAARFAAAMSERIAERTGR